MSCLPTGQLGRYNISPPPGGTLHQLVTKDFPRPSPCARTGLVTKPRATTRSGPWFTTIALGGNLGTQRPLPILALMAQFHCLVVPKTMSQNGPRGGKWSTGATFNFRIMAPPPPRPHNDSAIGRTSITTIMTPPMPPLCVFPSFLCFYAILSPPPRPPRARSKQVSERASEPCCLAAIMRWNNYAAAAAPAASTVRSSASLSLSLCPPRVLTVACCRLERRTKAVRVRITTL